MLFLFRVNYTDRFNPDGMKLFLFLVAALVTSTVTYAQRESIADSTGYRIIEQAKRTFPKFYREFQYIKANDTLIRKIRFVQQKAIGPAFASPKGEISINVAFIQTPKPNFDDNRLIVVLYHEVGHLHYYLHTVKANWTPEDSEKAAFEYSLLKTKEIAEKGDCLPLQSSLKFMKLRSEGDNLNDAHVRALKRMVKEPLYAEYLKYTAAKCNLQ